jgi:hypothetical protein
MKTILKSTLALLFMFVLSSNYSYAVVSTPGDVINPKAKKESAFTQLTVEEMFTMPRKDIEAKIGRKLKLKERLGFAIIKKAAKKASKKMNKKRTKAAANENIFGILSISLGGAGLLSTFFYGVSGLLLSIAGITLGIIGLKRDEPKRILSILGIVFGSIVLLLALLVIAVFAAIVI